MKFTVNKDLFQSAVAKAERITGKNLSLPVLRCALIEASGKTVKIRTTNLDLGMEIELAATVEKGGVVAIPADILNTFLTSSRGEGTISFELSDGHIKVLAPHSTTNITVYPHEDFPILPKVEDIELFTVSSSEFAAALRSVWWSATVSSIKPELSSVYVCGNGDELCCVATDSFRLAEKKVRARAGKGFESILIPLKNAGEMIRHLEGHTGDVVVRGNTHQISCVLGDIYLTSRVIDGTFPDYTQILPKEHQTEIIALKQDVLDALKQLRIFSDQFNKLTISVDPKAKKCVLKTTNTEVGDSTIELDGALSGDALDIHFNHSYVLDALQAIHTDSVALQFGGVGKPLTMRSVGDQSFVYIVMPMNR